MPPSTQTPKEYLVRERRAKVRSEYVDTLTNPVLIVEVFSESTEAYDRGEKFAHYRRLEPLAEYVLVAQDRVRVERFAREGDTWVLTEVSDPDGTLVLRSVGCAVSLREVYDRIDFLEGG